MDASGHCVKILDETVKDSWHAIASARNLATDAEVAHFLVGLFFSLDQSQQSTPVCLQCRRPLIWYCTTCQLCMQPASVIQAETTLHSSPQQSLCGQQTSAPVDVPSRKAPAQKQRFPPQQNQPTHLSSPSQDSPCPQQAPFPQQVHPAKGLPTQLSHSSDDDKAKLESEDDDLTEAIYSDRTWHDVKRGAQETEVNVTFDTVDNENQGSLSNSVESKSGTVLRTGRRTNSLRRHAKKAQSRNVPAKYNFRKKSGSSVKLDTGHLEEKLDVSVEEDVNIVQNEILEKCHIHQNQNKSALKKSNLKFTGKTSNSSMAKTHVQANYRRSTHGKPKMQTVVTDDILYDSECNFSAAPSSDYENKSNNDDVEKVSFQNSGALQRDDDVLKDLPSKELTNKSMSSKSKGRPRSKLVSGKYLGTLKKANGQVQFYSRFECAHCQEVFERKRDFNTHISSHYFSKPHICIKCGEGFRTRQELKQHKLLTHSKSNKQPKFICDQCPAEFKTEGRFHLHKNLHDQNKLFSCRTCGFVASSKETLNSHRLTHRKTARVQCEYCGETKRVNNMQRHLLMHRGEKPYSCTQCHAAFRTPFDLRDHVKRRHSEVKPFSCEICGKGFICSDNLKHHLLVHSGQKPFKCSICPSSFSRKDYLTKHIRTHTGEKPYKCPDCEEVFAYPNSLKLHKKQFHGVSGVFNNAAEVETRRENAPPKVC